MNEWKKVVDEVPDPHRDVLFSFEDGTITMGYYVNKRFYSYELATSINSSFMPEHVVYWMYVPELPKNEDEEKPWIGLKRARKSR